MTLSKPSMDLRLDFILALLDFTVWKNLLISDFKTTDEWHKKDAFCFQFE